MYETKDAQARKVGSLTDRYPPSPLGQELMVRRRSLDLSLRQAGAQLGLDWALLQDVEMGAKVFRLESDYARAMAALRREPLTVSLR